MSKRINIKRNYDTGTKEITFSKYDIGQKMLLIYILESYKINNRSEIKPLYNDTICNDLNISIPFLRKQRNILIEEKLIEVKKVRAGESFVLKYYPNWKKLKRLKFIIEHPKNEYKPEFPKKESKKELFKENEELTFESSQKLDDNTYYNIKWYHFEKGRRMGSGFKSVKTGKDIKRTLKIQNQKMKRSGKNEEYIYIGKTMIPQIF